MRKFAKLFLAALVIMSAVFTTVGCAQGVGSKTVYYTATTNVATFNEMLPEWELDDGYCAWATLKEGGRELFLNALTNEKKNNWTDAKLKEYLLSIGFDEKHALPQVEAFADADSRLMVSRSGQKVYWIIK